MLEEKFFSYRWCKKGFYSFIVVTNKNRTLLKLLRERKEFEKETKVRFTVKSWKYCRYTQWWVLDTFFNFKGFGQGFGHKEKWPKPDHCPKLFKIVQLTNTGYTPSNFWMPLITPLPTFHSISALYFQDFYSTF